MEAAKIHVYTPQEINMYRARARCEEKGKDIVSKGTKSNPPTGTGDNGFTLSNEFNALSSVNVLCGLAINDYKRGEVSGLDDYMKTGFVTSTEGALAGAAFCMVPYASEILVSTAVPQGMTGVLLPAGVYVSSETMMTGVMLTGYTATFSNMAVKVNIPWWV